MAAATKIANKEKCKTFYNTSLPVNVTLAQLFDQFTICTMGFSDVDVYGNYVPKDDLFSRRYGHNNTVKV